MFYNTVYLNFIYIKNIYDDLTQDILSAITRACARRSTGGAAKVILICCPVTLTKNNEKRKIQLPSLCCCDKIRCFFLQWQYTRYTA